MCVLRLSTCVYVSNYVFVCVIIHVFVCVCFIMYVYLSKRLVYDNCYLVIDHVNIKFYILQHVNISMSVMILTKFPLNISSKQKLIWEKIEKKVILLSNETKAVG